jgi:hypothetical protein
MYQQYSYEEVLAASERFAWRVEDLIGGERRLDFAKPFLPDSFARTEAMIWLTLEQRRVANQIRGAGYLHMFGLVEEFILPFVLDHVRPQLDHAGSGRFSASPPRKQSTFSCSGSFARNSTAASAPRAA